MMVDRVEVFLHKMHDNVKTPKYQTEGSAGFDIACLEDVVLTPKETQLIRTGLRMSVPSGYELQLRPRSGLSFKTELVIKNSPATIDSDYTGEIKIIAKNNGEETLSFCSGDRICQGVLNQIPQAIFKEVDKLEETERGGKGIGSSKLQ